MTTPTASLLIDASPATIGIRCPSELATTLSQLLPLAEDERADAWIDIEPTSHGQYEVAGITGPHLAAGIDGALTETMSQLNGMHIRHSPGVLHLHAAAAQLGESTVLLSGASGAGKSTLVAALHDRGFELLTDECVDISADATVRAWSKPLSLRPGGRVLLGREESDRYVAAERTRTAGSVGAVVVLDPDGTDRLEHIDRAEATKLLIDQSLDFGRRPRDLSWLARLVAGANTHRLGRSSLDTMCALVTEALDEAELDAGVPGEFVELDMTPPSRAFEQRLQWTSDLEGVMLDGRTLLFDRSSRRIITIDGSTSELAEALRAGTDETELQSIGIDPGLVSSLRQLGFVVGDGR